MSFFKKNSNDVVVKTYTEPKAVAEDNEVNSDSNINTNLNNIEYRKRDLEIMDKKITEYVIKYFPTMSDEIKDSLQGLVNTLEKTIDFIEDQSSELVKHERNFELSQAHRDTSIAIYDHLNKIKDYIEWMQETTEEKQNEKSEEKKDKGSSNKVAKNEKKDNMTTDYGDAIEIYKDFSGKVPKAFKLEEYFVKVSGWEDLTVKTADLLNKHFQANKESLKVVYQDMKIDESKSKENDIRDSVIDLLNDYNIYLGKFAVFIK